MAKRPLKIDLEATLAEAGRHAEAGNANAMWRSLHSAHLGAKELPTTQRQATLSSINAIHRRYKELHAFDLGKCKAKLLNAIWDIMKVEGDEHALAFWAQVVPRIELAKCLSELVEDFRHLGIYRK